MLFILFVLVCGLNFFSLFSKLEEVAAFNKAPVTVSKKCLGNKNYVLLRDIITIILRILIPILLIIPINLIIVYKLVKLRKCYSNFNSFMVKEYKFTISTLVLNAFYILTLLFNAVSIICLNAFYYEGMFINDRIDTDITNTLFRS